MKYPTINQFSQVKTENLLLTNISFLFKTFKLKSLLTRNKISKEKGITVFTMIFYIFRIFLENSRSIRSGLMSLNLDAHKSALNDFLNNPNHNWRNLLYGIVKIFAKKYGHDEGKYTVLIIDDTSKKKYGKHVEWISSFYDHANKTYYRGYQTVIMALCNLRTCIPVDFCLKTGKKKYKHSKKGQYGGKSHILKRYTESRNTKTTIALNMITRALHRRFKFDYVLWDSWYNCSSAYKYVFNKLIPKGIHLISMVKLSKEKYGYLSGNLNIREIYRKTGEWKMDDTNGVRYKSIIIEITAAIEK